MGQLKYLDLSTGHIKKENATAILDIDGALPTETNLYGHPYTHGSFVVVAVEINAEDTEKLLNDYNNGYEDIIDIIRYCLKHEISLIRFDADAEVMSEFKSYDW